MYSHVFLIKAIDLSFFQHSMQNFPSFYISLYYHTPQKTPDTQLKTIVSRGKMGLE